MPPLGAIVVLSMPTVAVAAFTIADGRIVAIDVVADPGKLRGLTVAE